MKSNEFDELVRQTFENARLPYNPENWQKLSERLDERKPKRRILFLLPFASIAASVAMALGVVTWVNKTDSPTIANSVKERRTHEARVAQGRDIIPEATDIPVTPEQSSVPNTPENPGKEETVPVIPRTAEQPVIAANVEQAPIRVHESVVPSKRDNIPQMATAQTNNNVFYDNVQPIKHEKKNYITMMGGINYGTLNSGYVMGLAAGTKINDKLYFESDVAFVGNISSNTSVSFITQRNPSPQNARSTDVSYTTKTVEQQRFYNIYYAQVTPTLGYKVAKKFSVGVGADVQRLLINDKLVSETDNKELPGFDLGVVGKTEYSLSKEIRASVYYRKGMNQSLSGDKYLDRDYLQVQLKFTIFNR